MDNFTNENHHRLGNLQTNSEILIYFKYIREWKSIPEMKLTGKCATFVKILSSNLEKSDTTMTYAGN